ncbi:hypothetical protein N9954_03105 [Maribacter sp.]|nr:hypothetical protein [Maribacter sp.]
MNAISEKTRIKNIAGIITMAACMAFVIGFVGFQLGKALYYLSY